MKQYLPFIIYFLAVSLITAVVTAIDKYKAKKGAFRISEATLFTLAAIGGALSEYLTMRLIRHKTLHKRFMIGLPLIIIMQIIATICLIVLI
ncbi:MAG: DUF1294 domain-containing protein [Clostridia bacterium]|nr:DUF1294 domain-containing protein [Clostridia bacterium]MBO7319412.1 DUF1294 domain-containing protein [Clostridia bacterium]